MLIFSGTVKNIHRFVSKWQIRIKDKRTVPVIKGFESEVIGALFLSQDKINRAKTIIILKASCFYIISSQI